MKKIIDYEKYIRGEQTIDTIGYDDPAVDIVEINNVFYKGLKLNDKGKDVEFAVNPITLVFKKTGVSGENNNNPSLSLTL